MVRTFAWFAIAVQPLFVAAWIVGGAVTPGYSHARSGVSNLAAKGMPHPWIIMAALALMGLSAIALAVGVRYVVRKGALAAAMFTLAGAGFLVTAFARLDCDFSRQACRDRFHAGDLSWLTSLHLWMGIVIALALLGTALALARALWPSPAAALALLAAAEGVVIFALGWLVDGVSDAGGLAQRVELLAVQVWFVIVAVGVLYETRGAPKLAAPVALRPRDFFGSSWAGEGQVQPWPYLLRIGPRFTFTRSTTWKTDDIGIVRDRATFGNGRVEERIRFAHIVDPAHIDVTSDDLPDGVKVTVDEQGYRTAPYKGLVPVGPLRFIVSCRDQAAIEPDGSLHYRVIASWHGLPVGRLDMLARTTAESPLSDVERSAT